MKYDLEEANWYKGVIETDLVSLRECINLKVVAIKQIEATLPSK